MYREIKILTDIIGEELLNKIICKMGGKCIYIPKQNKEIRNQQIAHQYKEGMSINQLCNDFNLTATQIYTILNKTNARQRRRRQKR